MECSLRMETGGLSPEYECTCICLTCVSVYEDNKSITTTDHFEDIGHMAFYYWMHYKSIFSSSYDKFLDYMVVDIDMIKFTNDYGSSMEYEGEYVEPTDPIMFIFDCLSSKDEPVVLTKLSVRSMWVPKLVKDNDERMDFKVITTFLNYAHTLSPFRKHRCFLLPLSTNTWCEDDTISTFESNQTYFQSSSPCNAQHILLSNVSDHPDIMFECAIYIPQNPHDIFHKHVYILTILHYQMIYHHMSKNLSIHLHKQIPDGIHGYDPIEYHHVGRL